ncbi:hypothetical protein [Neptunicella sp.]|uniref:hypothetical protein n=1 Tax=Neptunicella sp. TaxID=2125986 RepID=UPI003F68E2EF
MKSRLIKLLYVFPVVAVVQACNTTPKEEGAMQEEPEQQMAIFGICYDNRGCVSGDESAWSVTKNSCSASGGKSWYNSNTSSCVNL